MRLVLLAAAFVLAAAPGGSGAGGRGGGHSSGSHSSSRAGGGSSRATGHAPTHHASPPSSKSHAPKASSSTHSTRSHKAVGVQRNVHGKIRRDPEQRAKFVRTHPCPSTGRTSGACPGYVVDHVHALKHGGWDDPSNMQWQSKEAARAKDKWE